MSASRNERRGIDRTIKIVGGLLLTVGLTALLLSLVEVQASGSATLPSGANLQITATGLFSGFGIDSSGPTVVVDIGRHTLEFTNTHVIVDGLKMRPS
ncbi:hypothetical protein [Botrimarina hoheduenensis]|uniref:hypothetical protein n=1 Tax=Botrimarina hoheduenensis TaxID=2528000 RepID=UPI0011B6F10B|nr:hypothetical protein [Botrimarina hoheduenensis]